VKTAFCEAPNSQFSILVIFKALYFCFKLKRQPLVGHAPVNLGKHPFFGFFLALETCWLPVDLNENFEKQILQLTRRINFLATL